MVISLNIYLEPCCFRQLLRPIDLGERGARTSQLLCKIKPEREVKHSTLYFSVPLIDNDNTALFMGGCHRSCLSVWGTEKCEIILWNSSVKHKGMKDALLVNTGFAPGRIEGSGQTRRGENSVVKRPACTCKLTAGSVWNVMCKHWSGGSYQGGLNPFQNRSR